MPKLKDEMCTIEDIYTLPEGQRAELINGIIYNMSLPNRIHQKLTGELYFEIKQFIKRNGGSCEIYLAPFGVFLNEDDRTYVEPDISVVCDQNKLDEHGCKGAPDFIIEIVSPSSRKMDYSNKMTLYSNAGVREYWIVDPVKERTTVYRFEEDAAPIIIPFTQPIQVGIYNDLSITISEILN